MKISIQSSREIGKKCIEWATAQGYELTSMEECDVFISVLYDKIIPEDYINSRPCFNFHPGVLPWYRGAGAYSWVIINGEFETGVTLHEIDKDIDHGNVIHINRFPIKPNDTAEDLFHRAEESIFKMFKEFLPKILNQQFYNPVRQIEGRIHYRKDLDKIKDLTKFVRAFTFRGKDNCYFINKAGEKIELKYE